MSEDAFVLPPQPRRRKTDGATSAFGTAFISREECEGVHATTNAQLSSLKELFDRMEGRQIEIYNDTKKMVAFYNESQGASPELRKAIDAAFYAKTWVDSAQKALAIVGGVTLFLFGAIGWMAKLFILDPILNHISQKPGG